MNDYFCSVDKTMPSKPNPLLTNNYYVYSSKPTDTRQVERAVGKLKPSLGSGHNDNEISSYIIKTSLL